MDILLVAYKDMILSITQGYWEGRVSISKPIYMLAILDAIERNVLISNKIELNDVYIRNKFGEFYKQYNGNEKGYLSAFFIRPYYHLNTAPFYHLVWKEENRPPIKGHTPSARYFQEHLLYAKLAPSPTSFGGWVCGGARQSGPRSPPRNFARAGFCGTIPATCPVRPDRCRGACPV